MTFTQGYIQVYTGEGNGNTAAALGLALRAAGAGLKVYIARFTMSGEENDTKVLSRYADRITVESFPRGRFIMDAPSAEDVATARRAVQAVRRALTAGGYQVVIMEEVNAAAADGLFPVEEILDLMARKPASVELVITGPGADPRVIDRADLVTAVKAVKH
jgi:cob(I)alamin adenosyltransferase